MENTMFRNLFVAIPCVLAFACGASDQTGSGAADADATAIQHDSGSDLEASDGLGAPDGTDTLSPAQLAGQWVSPVCEAYDDGAGGKNYLTRDFTLTESSWNLVFTAFGDEACSYPLFSGEIEGPYALTGPSDAIADAVEGEFGLASVTWTALDAGIAEYFTSAACGSAAWEVGVAQDVSETGCIGVAHPVSACPVEYDVVAIDEGQLFFGERITNMCEPVGRPAALVSYGLDAAG